MLLKFEVYRDGRWWGAREMGHAVFTQARTLDKLYGNIKEAAHLHFEEEVENGEKLEILRSTPTT
ncbi:MAG: type II toxin-antitoxin system HicB family antitoxin [Chloroflexi bacterium]|nr:type II toxin-antitoxin system HicB family antitoxin [Chloroflexota bacterium]